jgi:hypothetical protein
MYRYPIRDQATAPANQGYRAALQRFAGILTVQHQAAVNPGADVRPIDEQRVHMPF